VQARLVSIERFPNHVVLHLDNGQVWEQIDDDSVDLRLNVGDMVTIDRSIGSYWVTGRNSTTAKVRLRH
jgi:hypothetical protein